MDTFDLMVIGGGPGGYVSAVRASQLGLRTALVEREALGGTCLNWGCVPTKSLLHNAEAVRLLGQGRALGFSFDNLTVDYAAAHKRSRSVVTRQTRRLAVLMETNGVTVIEGAARFISPHSVRLDSGRELAARHIIVATGARSRELPGAPRDGQRILSHRDALSLTTLPVSALIVGAGPIGMEFATLWNRYGVKVTVAEMLPRVLPLEDEDVSAEAARQFKKEGIAIRTGTAVRQVRPTDRGVEVTLAAGETAETIAVDLVLVAVGFVPNTGGLDLERAGVAIDPRGAVEVDQAMRTSAPHIHAIGDVTAKLGLAHVASAQGMIAAEAVAGRPTRPLNYTDIPRCTYSHPEVASVGLTERQAAEAGYQVAVATSPFLANGRAMALNDTGGFVKVVAEAGTGKLLGAHMVGGQVAELVAGVTGLLALGADAAQLGAAVSPHPSLSEAVMEAAHKLCGHAIHI